ncbi:MAG: helix-turn-helix domain-containing protein [Ktedonobacterales bacterium]
MNHTMDIRAWLTVPQAAKHLGVNNTSVYRAIERGRIEVVETPLGLLCNPVSVATYAQTRRTVRHVGEKVPC